MDIPGKAYLRKRPILPSFDELLHLIRHINSEVRDVIYLVSEFDFRNVGVFNGEKDV